MKTLPLALVALLAGPSSAPVDLAYAPAEGTQVTRRITSTLELSLDELLVVMDGQEIPPEYLPDLQIDVNNTFVLEVVDRVEKGGDGRPRRLHRTFAAVTDEATTTVFMPPDLDETVRHTGTCALVGKSVVFAWDDKAGKYDVAFADGVGEDEPLAGLVEDLDFRSLLPDGAVEIGAEWSVDPSFLHQLEAPGGTLPMLFTGGEVEEYFGPDVEWEGEVKMKFVGWDEDAAGRMALLRIGGAVRRETTKKTDLDQVPVADGTATEEIEGIYGLDGELAWDVAGGMMKGLTLTCSVSVLTVTTKDPGQDGPDFESETPMSGTWTFAVEVERE